MPPARLPEHFHWLTVQRYDIFRLFVQKRDDLLSKTGKKWQEKVP
jgi:hypothetical protein